MSKCFLIEFFSHVHLHFSFTLKKVKNLLIFHTDFLPLSPVFLFFPWITAKSPSYPFDFISWHCISYEIWKLFPYFLSLILCDFPLTFLSLARVRSQIDLSLKALIVLHHAITQSVSLELFELERKFIRKVWWECFAENPIYDVNQNNAK